MPNQEPKPLPVPMPVPPAAPRPTPTPPGPQVPAPGPQSGDRPGPLPPMPFRNLRAYMKNGATFKVVFVSVDVSLDGYNHYSGQGGISLCSIKRDDVSVWVNLDVPEETVQGEKGPVRVFPAGITISSGYTF